VFKCLSDKLHENAQTGHVISSSQRLSGVLWRGMLMCILYRILICWEPDAAVILAPFLTDCLMCELLFRRVYIGKHTNISSTKVNIPIHTTKKDLDFVLCFSVMLVHMNVCAQGIFVFVVFCIVSHLSKSKTKQIIGNHRIVYVVELHEIA